MHKNKKNGAFAPPFLFSCDYRLPFSYGLPNAAGASARPTKPASAKMVSRYGSMFKNSLGTYAVKPST
jgi:hypothetical protein